VLFGIVPWLHVPGLAYLAEPAKSVWRAIGHEGHEWLAFGTYLLLLLHVAGALKHQVFDRESPILARMAPGAQPGRWFDPRLLLIGAGGLAVIALAELVKPPLPAQAPAPATQPMTDDLPEAPPATAAPAAVQAPGAAATEAPKVQPLSAWSVDKGSSLAFATVWSGQAIEGQFERWTADISFSPDRLDKSKVKVAIDLTSARTGDAQRDASLAGPDWFDADAHGQAVFTATRFEKTGEDRYVAHGQLALRGVSKAFDLPFRLKIDGDKARMSGVTSLDRTAFGVGQGEWQATDQIPAAVKVSVKLTATRK
jgi:polyisoprenoid-binding protein YceI